jgi:hypothetical protein
MITIRYRVALTLVALLLLSVLLAQAAPVGADTSMQSSGRIAVVVFPDVAGEGAYMPDCPGCDEKFVAEDSDAVAEDPLPKAEVVLRDAAGEEMARNTTNALANGRHVTFFTVPEIGDYTIALEIPGGGWESCPDGSLEVAVSAEDFNEKTGIAAVNFYVWQGCDALPQVSEKAEADQEEGAVAPAAGEGEAAEAAAEEEAVTEEEAAEEAPAGEEAAEEEAAPTGEGEEAAEPEVTAEAVTEEEAAPTAEGEEGAEGEQAAEGEEGAAIQPLGGVQGLVFMDLNGNGVADEAEPGVAMVTVHLEGGTGVMTQLTTGAGIYTFADVPADTYDVYIETPVGYVLTTEDRYVGLVVSGNVIEGIDFGLATSGEAIEGPATAPAEQPEPEMPETGVQVRSTGGLLVALALVAGLLGVIGLAVESGLGRRTHYRKDDNDA